jgi:multidrug efflux pump subunit AcrA (membrane-fusion protein)
MKKWIVLFLCAVLAGLIGFRIAGAIRNRKAAQVLAGRETAVPVKLTRPESVELTDMIRASGNLVANNDVTLFSRVAGKVKANLVHLGSPVRAGQAVALVIRDEIGYEFQPYEVKSDVDGFVSKIFQNPGAAVNPAVPLMTVVDVDSVKAVASVDETRIRLVRKGQNAAVFLEAFPGEAFRAVVTNISPVSNPVNRCVDVEFHLPNASHRLKPGMYATVELTAGRRTAWIVPISALVEHAGEKVVFVTRDGRAAAVPVVTGAVRGDRIEVISGLNGSESVVSSGANRLDDGAPVQVVS